jgi:hypothetical protein
VVQEAGEYHLADPVYRAASLDGGRDLIPSSSLRIPVSDDGAADSPRRPLLARSVSVTLHNPQVAKAVQHFRTAFNEEVSKVALFFHQERQRLARDVDALAERQQALATSNHMVRLVNHISVASALEFLLHVTL